MCLYLILNGPHRGERHPSAMGGVLVLSESEGGEITYRLREISVMGADRTLHCRYFWVTPATPKCSAHLLNLLADFVGNP